MPEPATVATAGVVVAAIGGVFFTINQYLWKKWITDRVEFEEATKRTLAELVGKINELERTLNRKIDENDRQIRKELQLSQERWREELGDVHNQWRGDLQTARDAWHERQDETNILVGRLANRQDVMDRDMENTLEEVRRLGKDVIDTFKEATKATGELRTAVAVLTEQVRRLAETRNS